VQLYLNLKPHFIQTSRVLVPAGTSKSTLRRHGIQAVTRVIAYVANAVTLSSTMCTGGFELASTALRHQLLNGCIEYSVALTSEHISYFSIWNFLGPVF
jgi:hypothetical protein